MNVDPAPSSFFLSRYTLSASSASDFDSSMAASGTGLTIVAVVAVVFCALGAVILAAYNEKKVLKTISDKKVLAEEPKAEEEPKAD